MGYVANWYHSFLKLCGHKCCSSYDEIIICNSGPDILPMRRVSKSCMNLDGNGARGIASRPAAAKMVKNVSRFYKKSWSSFVRNAMKNLSDLEMVNLGAKVSPLTISSQVGGSN